jgi:threonyl-tRNA synthetase
MIKITLPDGTVKEFENNITGEQIASSIGAGLLKAALAIEVNGELKDLYLPINEDAKIRIITGNDREGLEIIRHDSAHILADAVKELYPDVQITIGPAIEDGFYYDIARKEPFALEDLETIEKKMYEIVARDTPIYREVWNRDEAVKYFKKIGEYYKAEIISQIPAQEEVSLYRQGNFLDLCKGPHAPSTGKSKAFKLMKIAGAYWRGDSNNEMLQRIYGTAWSNKKELNEYLHRLEEAEKRDHRKLGKELGLFHIEEESSGMIFWHEKGWTLFRLLENYIRDKVNKHGYHEVKTPVLLDRSLWEKSGHWEKFAENMFTAKVEDKIMALKPMSCPCHIKIFNQGLKSYRELPLRMAEFGYCHRNEPSGSLHGLMRVRAFTQDDGHIFCTEDQITDETIKFCELLKEVYKEMGFAEILVKFSDRPPKRAGSEEVWNKAEEALRFAVEAAGLEYEMNPGEGAFYGPKLEFILKDAIGRSWQCGTLQLDFVLPERLNAKYIGKDGNKHTPVMIHRAILGTIERFMGILIEHYAGKFPLWLAPVQVVVATITNEADQYAQEIYNKLKEANVRSVLDISNEKINYKVRYHTLNKVPYIIALGKNEIESKTISVRQTTDQSNKVITLQEFLRDFISLSTIEEGAYYK